MLGHEAGANETAPLTNDQTTVLSDRGAVARAKAAGVADLQFTITRQILLTHTDETIEIG